MVFCRIVSEPPCQWMNLYSVIRRFVSRLKCLPVFPAPKETLSSDSPFSRIPRRDWMIAAAWIIPLIWPTTRFTAKADSMKPSSIACEVQNSPAFSLFCSDDPAFSNGKAFGQLLALKFFECAKCLLNGHTFTLCAHNDWRERRERSARSVLLYAIVMLF